MKKTTKLIAAVLVTAISFTACQKEEVPPASNLTEDPVSNTDAPELAKLNSTKLALAKVLARAMANEDVRRLIKTEANKQFDKDYDVLLQLVKDQPVDSGVPFFQYLRSLAESKEAFDAMMQSFPLATVFVPKFLEFSADQWDVSSQIPWVAIWDEDNPDDKMIAFNHEGYYIELDPHREPVFDVVVLKENERVALQYGNVRSEGVTGSFIGKVGDQNFYFLDDAFNGTLAQTARITSYTGLDARIREAYEKVKDCDYCNHRDYIYHDIFPPEGKTKGPLNNKYAEAITALRLENTAVFNSMGGWAEGSFELHIIAFFLQGNETLKKLEKVISVAPEDIITYEEKEVEECTYIKYFGVKIKVSCKKRWVKEITGTRIYIPSTGTLTFAPWDMEYHGDKWLFKTFEFDPEGTYTETISHESTVGTNFKFDPSFGTKVKVGLSFGADKKDVKKASTNYTYSDTSENLGEALLRWDSPVIVSDWKPLLISKRAITYTLPTGSLVLSFETIRQSQ